MSATQLATDQYIAITQIYGDVKQGIQTTDHSGWIKLDGRLKSTLTASQQTQATALGIGTNLPDASNSFLVQNGTALGSVSGANTKTIAQNQLPNVTLGGSTNSAGTHKHDLQYRRLTDLATNNGTGARDVFTQTPTDTNTTFIQDNGLHTHTITTNSINGGVTQQTFDVRPQQLSINVFLYLGV